MTNETKQRLTETQIKISRYLRASAGTANWPSLNTIQSFIGMIQTGEADIYDFQQVGGDWIVTEMRRLLADNPQWGELRSYDK